MKLSATKLLLLATLLVNGCSTSSPIRKYSESKSHFRGKPTIVSDAPSGVDLYRVYQQGATGFVSIQSVRQTAERRADEFCERQGKTMRVISEQLSNPPYILGNFPRIEIVFACMDKPKTESPASDDLKFRRLTNLKKLLDEGILTKEEFEREKGKILND
ncbi:MAG: SHOCT domain-containing protein [Verrucomicrobiales bacterium]|nr:MAG: SHOCT domain-containing protein [Verrucomicrobiales bacterium]